MIKFNERTLKDFLKANKDRITKITEIFSDQEKLKYLENNDFKELYFNDTWPEINYNTLITGTLLLSGIDFLSHLTKIPGYCFRGLPITTIEIPDGVISIGNQAFCSCSDLTSINIPNSVTSIDYGAFNSCKGLTNITIPNGVTGIGEFAFYNCTSLTNVTIPDSVTIIGDYAFGACSSLTSITIPNSVTYIGMRAFLSCTKLKEIKYLGTKKQWKNIMKSSLWEEDSAIKEIKCINGTIEL